MIQSWVKVWRLHGIYVNLLDSWINLENDRHSKTCSVEVCVHIFLLLILNWIVTTYSNLLVESPYLYMNSFHYLHCMLFFFFFKFFLFIYFMIVTQRKRERAETQAEGEAGSTHREPDVGFDPRSPGSRPGSKAGAKPLRHPGIPIVCCFDWS